MDRLWIRFPSGTHFRNLQGSMEKIEPKNCRLPRIKMSLGIFRSIRSSYAPRYRGKADRMINSLNVELKIRGCSEYEDPSPDERKWRQLPCGNTSVSTFLSLGKIADEAGLPWSFGNWQGERYIALPVEFTGVISVSVGRIPFFRVVQNFLSLKTVRREVIALAPELAIPLSDGELDDEVSNRIADGLGVRDEEVPGFLENERAFWLDLYVAVGYCLEDCTPLGIG